MNLADIMASPDTALAFTTVVCTEPISSVFTDVILLTFLILFSVGVDAIRAGSGILALLLDLLLSGATFLPVLSRSKVVWQAASYPIFASIFLLACTRDSRWKGIGIVDQ